MFYHWATAPSQHIYCMVGYGRKTWMGLIMTYRKVPKFSDTFLLYCKHSKITKQFDLGVLPLNDANGIANSEDPDQ